MINSGSILPISLDTATQSTAQGGVAGATTSAEGDLFAHMFNVLSGAQTPLTPAELTADSGNFLPVGDNNLPNLTATVELEQELLPITETALLGEEHITGLNIELSPEGLIQTPVMASTEPAALNPLETKTPLEKITPVPITPVTPQQLAPTTDAEVVLTEAAEAINPALIGVKHASPSKTERVLQQSLQAQTNITGASSTVVNTPPPAAHNVIAPQTVNDMAQVSNTPDISLLQAQSDGGRESEVFQSRFAASDINALQGQTRPNAATDAPRATPTHTMTYTPDTPEWSNELADRVSIMMKHGPKEASIQMNPPELGRLNIQISTDGDKTTVIFNAQQATTREALEQAMPRLREILNDSGLELAQGEVFDQTASQQEQRFSSSGDADESRNADESLHGDEEHSEQLAQKVEQIGLVDAYI